MEKLKLTSRCFLCLNRVTPSKTAVKVEKFIVQIAENPIITPFAPLIAQYPRP